MLTVAQMEFPGVLLLRVKGGGGGGRGIAALQSRNAHINVQKQNPDNRHTSFFHVAKVGSNIWHRCHGIVVPPKPLNPKP